MEKVKKSSSIVNDEKKLKSIKKMINAAVKSFDENCKIFHNNRNFLFISNIDADNRLILKKLGDPVAEFNVLNAYVSRLLGEYAKQRISIFVKPEKMNPSQKEIDGCKFISGIIKSKIDSIDNYEIGRDVLTGGFSSIKVYIDYVNKNSFDLDIFPKKAYNPTLVFYDPNATEKTKSDARYYFELIPIPKETLIHEYENLNDFVSLKVNNYNLDNYSNENEKMVLICHFYLKEPKNTVIYLLDDGSTVTKEEYKEIVELHKKGEIISKKAPSIVKKRTRKDDFEIVRYEVCDNKILRKTKTKFEENSFIFCDGNSLPTVVEGDNGITNRFTQVVIPFTKYAVNAQMLLNRTMQIMIKFFETLIHGKWMYPIESVPIGKDANSYNPQTMQNVVYRKYTPNDKLPLDPPQLIQNRQLPPEIMQIFNQTPVLIQNIMGTYDAALGIAGNDLSGKAILNGAIQSNASAAPYTNNILKSYEHLAKNMINLLPLYYNEDRVISYIAENGAKEYIKFGDLGIFDNKKLKFNVEVEVRATFNFELQKANAMDNLIDKSRVLPSLSKILNEDGLPYIFDNYNFDGVDQFKRLAQDNLEKMKEAQKKQEGQPQQPPPEIIIAMNDFKAKMAKIQQDQEKNQKSFEISMEKLKLEMKELGLKDKKINADLISQQNEDMREHERLQTEKAVHLMDSERKDKELHHKIRSDHIQHVKDIANTLKNDDAAPVPDMNM